MPFTERARERIQIAQLQVLERVSRVSEQNSSHSNLDDAKQISIQQTTTRSSTDNIIVEDFRLLYYDIEDKKHSKVIAVQSWNMHCMPKSDLVEITVTNIVIVAMHVHALVVIQLNRSPCI